MDNSKILNTSLADFDARALHLAASYQLESEESVIGCPVAAFSQDCRRLAYVTHEPSDMRNMSIVIRDLVNLKKVKVIRSTAKPELLIWSPDSTKIIYAGEDHQSYFVDVASGNESRLPIQNFSLKDNYGSDVLWWKTPDQIFFVRDYSVWTLNLQNLIAEERHFRSRKEASDAVQNPSTHSKAKIAHNNMGGGIKPSLVIQNLDNSYVQPIRQNVYGNHPFLASPELHCVAVYRDGLHILYIEPANASQYLWSIALDITASLGTKEKVPLGDYLNAHIPFHANIYSPAVNPINKAITGPDRSLFKGRVTVKQWNKDHLILETNREFLPFQVGDIVADLASEQSHVFGNWPFEFKGRWFPLQVVDQEELLKKDDEMKREESNKKKQMAGQLRGKFPRVFEALENKISFKGVTQKGTQLEFTPVKFDGSTGEFTGILKNSVEPGHEEVVGKFFQDGVFAFRSQGNSMVHRNWKGTVGKAMTSISGTFVEVLMLAGGTDKQPGKDHPHFEFQVPASSQAR